MKELLKKIPVPFKGEIIERKENCRLCGEKRGMQIGLVDYWDISSNKLIKCTSCGLVQLDPMLTQEETAKGCLAYYIEESLRVSEKSQGKDLVRNFRRGVLFASFLKRKNYHPKEILELGPGSGYFSLGSMGLYPLVVSHFSLPLHYRRRIYCIFNVERKEMGYKTWISRCDTRNNSLHASHAISNH